MDQKSKSRLELAHKLREEADQSSEAALRSALSRSYYSVYHAANALLGRKMNHGELPEKLAAIDQDLGNRVKRLRELRVLADYDQNYVTREFAGNLEFFRIDARDQVKNGLEVFTKILTLIEQRAGDVQ